MKTIKKIVCLVLALALCLSVGATAASAAVGYIGEAKAKEIALSNAGVSESDARFLTCKLDYDDGLTVYDVEFYFGRCEYSYEINAKTGAIVKAEKDEFGTNVPDPDAAYIGEAKAKEIALADAGVKESDARRLKVKFDFDDGRAEYEVEFHADKFDYDYEIDAVTGKIIKAEKDREFSFSDVFFIEWITKMIALLRNFFK